MESHPPPARMLLKRAWSSSVGRAISLQDGRLVLLDPQAHGKWQVSLGTTPIGHTEHPDSPHLSFQADVTFLKHLHGFMASQVTSSQALAGRARALGVGWMNIRDERVPEVFNRCPEPEDIVGVVRVEEGRMLEGSYQPMPAHRLWSANGLFRLPYDLANKFE